MRSVELSGPGEDGTSLVLRAEDGEQFVLPVDETVRAAVTSTIAGHRTPASPGEDHELTPREIQVRIRAGESPDELADESGTGSERILRFASPVLAERARVADEARRSRARRDGDGALVGFGETVDRRFAAHDIDPASVGWDAVRRPDGTWLVIATWHGGDVERRAHWAFSLTARTVLAADEVAGDLLSERPLRPVVRVVPDAPAPRDPAAAGGSAGDRPAGDGSAADSYGDAVFDQESGAYGRPNDGRHYRPPAPYPGTPDPLPPAQWGPPTVVPEPSPDSPPLPLDFEPATARDAGLGILADYRTGPIPADSDFPDPATAGADLRASDSRSSDFRGSHSRGADVSGVDSRDADVVDAEIVEPADSRAPSDADVDQPPLAASPPPTRRGGGRSKAAREQTKIPSWDDILLGVRRKQD